MPNTVSPDGRPGLSIEEAAEIMWAYSSPELCGLLVLSRGWPPERYGDLGGESLADALLKRDTGNAHHDPV